MKLHADSADLRTVVPLLEDRLVHGATIADLGVRSPDAAATMPLNGVRHITADVPVLLAMMSDPVTDASAAELERVANA